MSALPVPILCYHRIAELPTSDPLSSFSITPQAFARQMRWLIACRYRILPLAALAAPASPQPPRCAVITFDDGYLDTYEEALPILQQQGFPATVFLVSGWLDGTEKKCQPPATVLQRSHVLEMSQHGITAGAHSRAHRRLDDLSSSALWAEVAGSKADLESALGLPIRFFAYPYGLYNPAVGQAVRSCQYDLAVAVNNGTADPYSLHRIPVVREDSLLTFAWKLLIWPRRLREHLRKSRLRTVARKAQGHA